MSNLDRIKYVVNKRKTFILFVGIVFFAIGAVYGYVSMDVQEEQPFYKVESRVLVIDRQMSKNSVNIIAEYMMNKDVQKDIERVCNISIGNKDNRLYVKPYEDYGYLDVTLISANKTDVNRMLGEVLEYGITEIEKAYNGVECKIIKTSDVRKVMIRERGRDVISQNNYTGIDRYIITDYAKKEINRKLPIEMGISTAILGLFFVIIILLNAPEKR